MPSTMVSAMPEQGSNPANETDPAIARRPAHKAFARIVEIRLRRANDGRNVEQVTDGQKSALAGRRESQSTAEMNMAREHPRHVHASRCAKRGVLQLQRREQEAMRVSAVSRLTVGLGRDLEIFNDTYWLWDR